ncbi:hypothetical protein JCM8547_006292 [Rhodosporidiobolus lusitaniae]
MAPKAAQAASTSKATPSTATPAGPKRRKLACFPCRERRVRCDWPEGGGGCAACASARLSPTEVELRMAKYQFGSAVVFALIEDAYTYAMPLIPGLPWDFIRDFVKRSGGQSREAEIAAEVMCTAFVAMSATFSDNSLMIGQTDLYQPVDSPLGVTYDYTPYLPYGQRRRDALEALTLQARQTFETSGMRHRPSMEAIYVLIVMDATVSLVGEKGRAEREYLQLACGHWRTMLGEKRGLLSEEQVGWLTGPIGIFLLSLDAQSAACLRMPCAITDADLAALVPHFSSIGGMTPVLDTTNLLDPETGWTALSEQLAPLSLSTTALYRAFTKLDFTEFANPSTLSTFYTALDSAYAFLITSAQLVASLPPLHTPLSSAWRAFDLFGLVNSFRRSLLRLDLLLHQRIVDALLASSQAQGMTQQALPKGNKGKNASLAVSATSGPPPPPPGVPNPALLQAYLHSRQRIQRGFMLAAELARHAIETSSIVYAREICSALECCSSWTSMRNAEPGMAAELCGELGITVEMGQSFLSLLSLASWSTHAAYQLHTGLTRGLTLLNGNTPLPPSPFPPPPREGDGRTPRGGARPSAFAFGGGKGGKEQDGGGRTERRRRVVEMQREREAREGEARERSAVGSGGGSGGGGSGGGGGGGGGTGLGRMMAARMMGRKVNVPKQPQQEIVQDWSFLDEFMTPEDKAKEATALAARAAAGPSASPPTQTPSLAGPSKTSWLKSKLNPPRYERPAVPPQPRRASAATGSSGSTGSRPPPNKQQRDVQDRLAAAAAPLKFRLPMRRHTQQAAAAAQPSIHAMLAPPQQQQSMSPPPPQQHQQSQPPPSVPMMQQAAYQPATLTQQQQYTLPVAPSPLPQHFQQPPPQQYLQQQPSYAPSPQPGYPSALPPAASSSTPSFPTYPSPPGSAASFIPGYPPPPPPPSYTPPTDHAAVFPPSLASTTPSSLHTTHSANSSTFSLPLQPAQPPPPQQYQQQHYSQSPLSNNPSLPVGYNPPPSAPSPFPPASLSSQPSYSNPASPPPTTFEPSALMPSFDTLEPLDAQTLALLASLPDESGAAAGGGGGDVAMQSYGSNGSSSPSGNFPGGGYAHPGQVTAMAMEPPRSLSPQMIGMRGQEWVMQGVEEGGVYAGYQQQQQHQQHSHQQQQWM